ncbi:hypothetical protein B0H17DRAFT_917320 [Mycena rosella]|uniref:Uncharacterized protein n=1 Tax=Mycena rosella TaxID=1033263 RepID=A0AAD7GZ64_MYCRO|nr:hypothetical protein B0H17DRAFT_917320 [Mycena rosella]
MPTFKVVIIGASGVDKTNLRQVRPPFPVSALSRSLPHSSAARTPATDTTLQIGDTAGQECFVSLPAAVLMYNVTRPETLATLTTWWAEFRACAPVSEEDVCQGRFCVVVVGNKCDLLEGEGHGQGQGEVVSAAQGARFVCRLVRVWRRRLPRPGRCPHL